MCERLFLGRWRVPLVNRIALAEQNDGDIAGEKESLEEAKTGLAKLHKELDKLGDEVAASEVHIFFSPDDSDKNVSDFGSGQAEHAKAEEKLQDEMATLSRFDMELKELNQVIKEKKAMVSQADLNVQEFQHDIQVLNKDKTSSANKVASLEATYEWIEQDKE